MARPQKNNADYFSHDNNMRNDTKIQAVRSKFGNEGYAIWSMLLEVLAEKDGFKLKLDDETDWEILAGDLRIETERLREIIEYLIKISLVVWDGTNLVCPKLIQRLQPLIDDRERKREWRESRVEDEENPKKGVCDRTNGIKDGTNPINPKTNPQSKVKESKVKKSKEERVAKATSSKSPEEIVESKEVLKRVRINRGASLTDGQRAAIKRMKCLDYFHREGVKFGYEYLMEEDDQANRKFQGIARSFEKRYPMDWRKVIDWWFSSKDHVWCDYHPSNFFSVNTWMKYDNKGKGKNNEKKSVAKITGKGVYEND